MKIRIRKLVSNIAIKNDIAVFDFYKPAQYLRKTFPLSLLVKMKYAFMKIYLEYGE